MIAHLAVIDILRRKFGIVLPYLTACIPAQLIRLRTKLIRTGRNAIQLPRGIAFVSSATQQERKSSYKS